MDQTDTTDVFLSYATRDRERVELLASALRSKGWSLFWDQELIGGEPWRETIEDHLAKARCVVAVWSANARNSDWVKYEAARGHDRGILVPVSIDGTSPSTVFDPIQTVDLTGWEGDVDDLRLARVVKGVERVLARHFEATEEGPQQHSVELASPTKRRFGFDYTRAIGIAGGLALASSSVAVLAPERIPALLRLPTEITKRADAPRPIASDLFTPIIASMKVPVNAYMFAEDARSKGQAVLEGSTVTVRKDEVDGLGTHYRVIIEPSRNLEQAEIVCNRLVAAGLKKCFLVVDQRK